MTGPGMPTRSNVCCEGVISRAVANILEIAKLKAADPRCTSPIAERFCLSPSQASAGRRHHMWEEATRGPGGGSRALPGSCHCCAFGGRDEGRPSERGHLFSSKPNKPAPRWLPPSWPPRCIIKKFPFGRERPEQPKQPGLFIGHKALSRAELRDGPDFGYSFCVSRLWLETLHKILPYIDGRSLFSCILAVY